MAAEAENHGPKSHGLSCPNTQNLRVNTSILLYRYQSDKAILLETRTHCDVIAYNIFNLIHICFHIHPQAFCPTDSIAAACNPRHFL